MVTCTYKGVFILSQYTAAMVISGARELSYEHMSAISFSKK